VDYYVIPYSAEQYERALEVGQRLREHAQRYRCDVDFSGRKLKRALERADEVGARKAILLMPDELARGEVVLRDMAARQETRVKLEEFLAAPA
jgi:histidyl-tRNA synthetase